MKQRHPSLMAAAGLVLLSLLSACGGGSDAPAPVAPPVGPGQPTGPQPVVQKALVINIDGVVYSALQQAVAARSVPALASMKIAPAFSGGVVGTTTEQTTTGTPGWASVVTGTWADRHGVQWDTADQPLKAASLFAQFKLAPGAGKTAAVTSNSAYQRLLAQDTEKASLDASVDCAGVDSCVGNRTREFIEKDYALVVAQFGAVSRAAQTGGLQGDYQKTLSATSAAIGELMAAIAKRQQANPNEDWLIIATTGEGLGRYGNADGLQADQNKTAFIAVNKTLPNLPAVGQTAAVTGADLYKLAAITDVAPTVLRHLGAAPKPALYAMEGQALQGGPSVRPVANAPGEDRASIVLSWTIDAAVSRSIELLRDGEPLATLAPDARSYTDTDLKGQASGVLTRRYTLVVDGTVMSTLAQINYVKPVSLAATLINQLRSYFKLDALPPQDEKNASTLVPLAPTVTAASLVADDNFIGTWKGNALRVDSRIVDVDGKTGYRLVSAVDVTSSPQFTVGFWFRTDATCSQGVSNGSPILVNKSWVSGNTAGLAVGLFAGCDVQFNLGSGTARVDLRGNPLTAGRWAYIALGVDRPNLKMYGYVFDPVKGVSAANLVYTAAMDSKLGGGGTGFSLNEDATGLYYKTQPSSPRGAMDFNELATWDRLLSQDELNSIYLSGRPLSTLAATLPVTPVP